MTDLRLTPEVERGDAAPPAHEGKLQQNAVSLGGIVALALGSAGPTASISLSLAALVAASAFASPLVVLACGLPMLGIGLAFAHLNRQQVDCGGSYEWVGKAITPSLGFMVGWMIVLIYLLSLIGVAVLIGPIAIGLVDSHGGSSAAQAIVGSVAIALFTVPGYLGVRAAARTQWVLIAIEYVALFALAGLALVSVFTGASGTHSFSLDWFSWDSAGGLSGFVDGALIAVFMYSGWDSAVFVNEESKEAHRNPGRAMFIALCTLALLYAFLVFSYQASVPADGLQEHSETALSYIAVQLSGEGFGKVMLLAVLLSCIGAGLASIVSASRVAFAMASDRALPRALAATHPKHKTPHVATVLLSLAALAAVWAYSTSSGAESAFEAVVSTIGLLVAMYFAATACALIVTVVRAGLESVWQAILLVVIPGLSALFLLFIAYKAVPELGGWGSKVLVYLYVMLGAGVVLLLYARLRRAVANPRP